MDRAEDRKKWDTSGGGRRTEMDGEENSLTDGDKVNREFELRLVGFSSVKTHSER